MERCGSARRPLSWRPFLWRGLRGGEPRWRRSIRLAGFSLDLYCEAARLAVEVEGARSDPAYDARQDRTVAEAGVLTLRFSNAEVEADPEGCLAHVRAVAAARAGSYVSGLEEA